MIRAAASALLLLVSSGGDEMQPRQRPPAARPGSLTVHQQIIIRVSPGGRRVAAGGRLISWAEERGPRCVAARQIVHADLMRQESVDLILRDGSRLRARLERRCPALDYYYGFYVSPTPDGMICADRDSIRSRVGGECQIERFRTLRAAQP